MRTPDQVLAEISNLAICSKVVWKYHETTPEWVKLFKELNEMMSQGRIPTAWDNRKTKAEKS